MKTIILPLTILLLLATAVPVLAGTDTNDTVPLGWRNITPDNPRCNSQWYIPQCKVPIEEQQIRNQITDQKYQQKLTTITQKWKHVHARQEAPTSRNYIIGVMKTARKEIRRDIYGYAVRANYTLPASRKFKNNHIDIRVTGRMIYDGSETFMLLQTRGKKTIQCNLVFNAGKPVTLGREYSITLPKKCSKGFHSKNSYMDVLYTTSSIRPTKIGFIMKYTATKKKPIPRND